MYSTDNGPHRNSLARRRHDAVPQREEHQLGRRVPHSAAGALAGQDQGRHRSRTRSSSTTTGCRPSSRWPASRTSSRSCKKGYQAIGRTYKNHIDGFNLLPYLTGKEKESPRKLLRLHQRRRRHPRRCATTTGRSCSWSSAATARCRSGRSRSRDCGCPRSSTCAPIRTSSRTSRRTRYYEWFLYHAYILYAAHDHRRRSSRRRSRTSRRSRSRTPSRSTTRDARKMAEARTQGRHSSQRPARWHGAMASVSAAILERRRGEVGDPRFRRARHEGGRCRTSCRPPSASRPSTTTARCGASSRCRCRSSSPRTAWSELAAKDPSMQERQPYKAFLERDMKTHRSARQAGGVRDRVRHARRA